MPLRIVVQILGKALRTMPGLKNLSVDFSRFSFGFLVLEKSLSCVSRIRVKKGQANGVIRRPERLESGLGWEQGQALLEDMGILPMG